YGVGAKIAAAPRNHHGLVYLSWKKGVGSTIHLWKNATTGQYGLRQFDLGDEDDSNTVEAPEGAPAPSRWVARYLNSRYLRFPEGITVQAREGWEHPR